MDKLAKLLTMLLCTGVVTGCADDVSGFSCDLGLGEYTEAVCRQAGEDANCESVRYEQEADTFCAGTVPGTRQCCHYEGCESELDLPTPGNMSCTP